MKDNVKALRQIIADAIEANPEAYTDVVLGFVLDSVFAQNSGTFMDVDTDLKPAA